MTQKKQVEEKLLRDGFCTNFWAIDTRTTLRLGDIIFKLRKEGWEFSPDSGYIGDTKNWKYILTRAPKVQQTLL